MEFNSFLFPAPQSSYSMHGAVGEIIYIPRVFETQPKHKEEDVSIEKEDSNKVHQPTAPIVRSSDKENTPDIGFVEDENENIEAEISTSKENNIDSQKVRHQLFPLKFSLETRVKYQYKLIAVIFD